MTQTRVTSSDLKFLNLGNIFAEVYSRKEVSKQALASSLHLSMPTITQSLKEMDELQLIKREGLFESTGGRRAQIYQFNYRARIAIGVMVKRRYVRILAVDLMGDVISEKGHEGVFEANEHYYSKLGSWINTFVDSLGYPEEVFLGVKIAVQGLLSPEGVVTYSKIYDCNGLSAQTLQPYIKLPCSLIHDTESAAFAELWFRPDIKDGVLLRLNRYFGGALVLNGEVYRGNAFTSGVLEHMCLDPNGPVCYCGKSGCIETFCSVRALERQAGEDMERFFFHLRKGDPERKGIWDQYLWHLALAIDNIRMLIDCDIIIAGHMFPQLTEEDFVQLENLVRERCAVPAKPVRLHRSCRGVKSAPLGAALVLVETFLRDTGFNMERCKNADWRSRGIDECGPGINGCR